MPDKTLEEFVAAPQWRRDLYRKLGGQYPPDEELAAPPEYVGHDSDRAEVLVYFVQAKDGTIKIGTGTNIKRRLMNLQVAHAYPLELLVVTSGGASEEYRYHHRFREHRLSGEWFSPHPDILAEIGRLRGD